MVREKAQFGQLCSTDPLPSSVPFGLRERTENELGAKQVAVRKQASSLSIHATHHGLLTQKEKTKGLEPG